MPAAAVIPALKVHRIIAAVKKLVVGSVPRRVVYPRGYALLSAGSRAGFPVVAFAGCGGWLASLL